MTHHTDAERAEFEAWAQSQSRGINLAWMIDFSKYADFGTNTKWLTWQAARRAPAAPVPQGWIDPNDKAQKQYLPHIGERVLFKHDGCVYLGKHTGGSFKAEYPLGKTFGTWDCKWMYPSVLDAAAPQPPACNPSMQPELATYSAPVQLPEPVAKVEDGGLKWHIPDSGYSLPVRYLQGTHKLYTEQQVRELLANHGIQEKQG